MKVVFMGTPDFAAASLRRLVADGHEVCGVFTQPDKPRNRGMKLMFSPVKEYALSENLPVYQPERMRDTEAIALLRALAPELAVVAAYGQLLPEDVLAVPAYGCINVHASLLPKYRGAAPINWAILNGDAETGVTIMHMAKKLDAGDIISMRKTAIAPDEDAAALYARLAELGAGLLSETLPAILDGSAARTPQDDSLATYAPMLSRELSPVDWHKPARVIVDQVRGLVPWPCASAALGGGTAKLWRAELGGSTADAPGTMRAGKCGVEAACGDGNRVVITELQVEGGKRMAASAWLNGRRAAAGTVIA